jgi:hypothetical protein
MSSLDQLPDNLAGGDNDDGKAGVLVSTVNDAPRTRIMLEENDQIPPNGQFFGADGVGYMLKAGEEADVPESIISILNSAVMSVPVLDDGNRVTGYRDKLRFPYRIITESRPGA